MNLRKISIMLLLTCALLSLSALPYSGNATQYKARFLQRGPRTDELHVKFYSDGEEAYDALEGGEIETMTWALTDLQYERAINNSDVCVGFWPSYETDVIRPDGNAQTDWQSVPVQRANWDCVDDFIVDNTDYVWTGAIGTSKQDIYTLSNVGVKWLHYVTLVRLWIRACSPGSTTTSIDPKLVIGSTSYYGSPISLSNGYCCYPTDWAKNPKTSTSWTWSDINDLKAGFRLNPPGGLTEVSQLYVELRSEKLKLEIAPFSNKLQCPYTDNCMVNDHCYLNSYRTVAPSVLATEPVRIGSSDPESLNILCGNQCDHICLDVIYSELTKTSASNPEDAQPWIAQDWHVGTWYDPEVNDTKAKLTYWFRKDVNWVTPVTGETLYQFNATDYIFSGTLQYRDPLTYNTCSCQAFRDVHHFKIVDDYCVEVYMDVKDYWTPPTGPLLPQLAWYREPLTYNTTDTFIVGTNYTEPGILNTTRKPVFGRGAGPRWFSWQRSVGPAKVRVDVYSWCRIRVRVWLWNMLVYNRWLNCWTSPWPWQKGNLYLNATHVLTEVHNEVPEVPPTLSDGENFTITYWSVGNVSGFTPGNLPWEEILVGCGPYYVTDFVPGVGMTLKANRYYFIETPPLGEIDWRWNWGLTDEGRRIDDERAPRTGFYSIDIYDIVKICSAYGSTGTGEPDLNWLPEADVAPRGGEINIYDVVIICGNYGEEFAHPPVDP